MRRSLVLFVLVQLAACSDPASSDPADGGAVDAPEAVDATLPERVPGLSLMPALAGLWTGPATQTRLGDFPMMNLDFRAATPGLLFARVDLDAQNSLRMALGVETLDGSDVLVFRNGGLFMGLSRDTRTVLVEHDDAARTYRFCARESEGGCAYTDATFSFSAEDRVLLEVLVRGMPHLRWDARRVEARELPSPFPASDAPIGTGVEDFPPMPSLGIHVTWSAPLEADADVWVILATTPCLSGTCVPSRWIRTAASAGTTSAVLVIDQIHAGAYRGTAILDRDRNVAATLSPGPGDGVSIPDASVMVRETGETTGAMSIVADL